MQQDWPADRVERWSVDRLVPYANNARTHSEAQVAQIAASIEHWGWTIPILVDETGLLIAGHGRVLAARRLGLTEVPVMFARGWSEEKKRAYTLADNKLALNADWDPELLRLELGSLRSMDADLGLLGFSEAELAGLMGDNSRDVDPEDTPEPLPIPISAAGDIWLLGRHRLACGDCTDPDTVQRALNGAKPHLMVTDPPYGVDYDPDWRNRSVRSDGTVFGARAVGTVRNDDRADWSAAWALFPGDAAYVWHGGLRSVIVAESLMASGFQIRSQIIWEKQHFIIGRGHYHWQHEPCWYVVRKGAAARWVGDRKQSTVWQIHAQIGWESARPNNPDKASGHGTQKPVECMRRPIENNSQPRDVVYEPFSGSGTTIIAAEMTERACRAVEINPIYVDVAVRRWENFAGKQATLEASGQTLAEVAAERAP